MITNPSIKVALTCVRISVQIMFAAIWGTIDLPGQVDFGSKEARAFAGKKHRNIPSHLYPRAHPERERERERECVRERGEREREERVRVCVTTTHSTSRGSHSHDKRTR